MVTAFLEMIPFMGWVCFVLCGFYWLVWFDNNNYYMPPLYVLWSIVFSIVTTSIALLS